MNELNYASLGASQKLHEAGIVLKTDALWSLFLDEFHLIMNTELHPLVENYPAPSIAEVWRELPEKIEIICLLAIEKVKNAKGGYDTLAFYRGKPESVVVNSNFTDALIELYMWLEKEKKK